MFDGLEITTWNFTHISLFKLYLESCRLTHAFSVDLEISITSYAHEASLEFPEEVMVKWGDPELFGHSLHRMFCGDEDFLESIFSGREYFIGSLGKARDRREDSRCEMIGSLIMPVDELRRGRTGDKLSG